MTMSLLQAKYTPLHKAARYGHTELVQLLLAVSGDPNAEDEVGASPTAYR
jgi:ankyrin repeat protein